jgi:hypothetical protein
MKPTGGLVSPFGSPERHHESVSDHTAGRVSLTGGGRTIPSASIGVRPTGKKDLIGAMNLHSPDTPLALNANDIDGWTVSRQSPLIIGCCLRGNQLPNLGGLLNTKPTVSARDLTTHSTTANQNRNGEVENSVGNDTTSTRELIAQKNKRVDRMKRISADAPIDRRSQNAHPPISPTTSFEDVVTAISTGNSARAQSPGSSRATL